MNVRKRVALVSLVFILLASLVAGAAVPSLINYQGRLANSTGMPVNGNVAMHFAFWDKDRTVENVVNENVTMTGTSPIPLAHQNLAAGSVTVTAVGGAPVYESPRDYLINYANGTITRVAGGFILSGTPVEVDYQWNSPGNLLWGETITTVPVSQGLYNVILGGVHPIPPAALAGSTVYMEVLVGAERLAPRQRLTSVPYALNAGTLGGTPAGDYYSKSQVDGLLAAMQAQINALSAGQATNTADILDLDGRVTAAEGDITDLDGRIGVTEVDIAALQTDLAALDTQVAAHQRKLAPVVATLAGQTVTDLTFTGINVRIVSGSGATYGPVNGRGNLIVGYNELRGSGDDRTGSHNIVVGQGLNFSSYGGLVVGLNNSIAGTYASVSGGSSNLAFSDYTSVTGGINNVAGDTTHFDHLWGEYSTVSGGRYNVAAAYYSSIAGGGGFNWSEGNRTVAALSSILGGTGNIAGTNSSYGVQSTICGGYQNVTSGYYASVSGGERNTASGSSANISGGYYNRAKGVMSSISGGANNEVNGVYCSISGGEYNTASNYASSVSGGFFNTASSNRSSVSGGYLNQATGSFSSVSGGSNNIASGDYTTVAGGGGSSATDGNVAFANYSAILGGARNLTGDTLKVDHTLGQQSTVSGGQLNTASGAFSSASGGQENRASGQYASVTGGRQNKASGDWSFIGGGGGPGVGNEAFGYYAAILGGVSNFAGDNTRADMNVGTQSAIAGGSGNSTTGYHASVSGGVSNLASNSDASVSGGYSNTASGTYSSVCGGTSNVASGQAGSVSGGAINTAGSYCSNISGGAVQTTAQMYQWIGGAYHSP